MEPSDVYLQYAVEFAQRCEEGPRKLNDLAVIMSSSALQGVNSAVIGIGMAIAL